MARAFVTGGTGFVGGAILDRLALEPDLEVRALARDRTGGEIVRGKGAEPVMGDVLEPDTLEAGMAGCDLVFHAAGVNEMCKRDPSMMFRVNVDGAVAVVAAAARAGVRRVVHTSSAAAVGEAAGTVGTEDSPHRGSYLSNYERSKHEGEMAVLAAGARLGVEVVAVCPSSVQGPGRSTGTAEFLIAFLNGKLRTAIDTTLSLVDVADCSEGHLLAARRGEPGARYLLSAPPVGARDLVRSLAAVTGLDPRIRLLPTSVARPLLLAAAGVAQALRRDPPICMEMARVLLHGHAYDGSKASRELGLEYRPLTHTLHRAVAWLVEYGFVRRPLPNYPRG